MTQEEKDLLLKDLSARLPYGVKCRYPNFNIDGTYEDALSSGINEVLKILMEPIINYHYAPYHRL